ncbi:YafY family protein [Paenibacillus sp. FSL M7-1455]|uniref:DeoR family transcriptional regulator n=1 Tax=Paenibacillus cookii TaxID=157839 RepID=A0ABQ4M0G6_9BACL|nr:YafY family protein [Paenibacillus cookii]GIO68878.1 DeoR family transcriptional regulator [Paenibacillus cookii]HWO55452.1 YafY family protein [Paenibacillus cookii]
MKIDRVLAMTVLLLNRGRISAKELADRFEVSTKTIYRDMDTLSRAGIPVAAYPGASGGFELMEHYTISRQHLTFDEIASIFAAVKGVKVALDDRALDGLLEKVGALLRRPGSGQGAAYSEKLLFDLNPWGQGKDARGKLGLLRQAMEQSRRVRLQYINMNGTDSGRVVEPGRLILKGNVWYVQAYCLLRGDFRSFRLSRIQGIEVLDERFEPRELPPQEQYDWKPDWSEAAAVGVTLRFSAAVRHRVGDAFDHHQVHVLEDGSLRVQGDFPLDEWFYGMILSYGGHVVIEEPAQAAEEVVRRAEHILRLYRNADTLLSTSAGYNGCI